MTLISRCRSGLRAERGATFVEYAMLVGLFAAASIVGIEVLTEASEDKIQTVSTNVGDPPKVEGSVPP